MTQDRVNYLENRRKSMRTKFDMWKNDYITLSRIFFARKLLYLEDLGVNQDNLRLDVLAGTGIKARKTLSAGMHAGMTSPANPWFNLTLDNKELAARHIAQRWLADTRARMSQILSRSNFYSMIHTLYDQLCTFGTAFMFVHPDEENVVRFEVLSCGEFFMDVDANGKVDTVCRSRKWSAKNIVAEFGIDRAPEDVKLAVEKPENERKEFEVVHMIFPNTDRDPVRTDNRNMRFTSVYYIPYKRAGNTSNAGSAGTNQGAILRESGFMDFPGAGPRWDTISNEPYGMSPAMDILGDVNMLQEVWATYLMATQKQADPAMARPNSLDSLDTLPGGDNVVNEANGTQSIYAIQQIQFDTQGCMDVINRIDSSIREGMYNDLFRILTFAPNKTMTATEVAERVGEKLQLGPVIERLHAELFTPIINRVFNLMLDADEVPDIPPEIGNQNLEVEFISTLAQYQKRGAFDNIEVFVDFIARNSQLISGLVDVIDADAMGDRVAEFIGVDPNVTTSSEQRAAMREQQNQIAALQANAQLAQMGANAAKTAADTPVNDGTSTLLDSIAGAQPQQ